MTRALLATGLVLWLALAVAPARAHEVRPAYLEIHQSEGTRYTMRWKQPATASGRLTIEPVLEPGCAVLEDSGFVLDGAAATRRWTLDCGSDGLADRRIVILGLERTLTDVLVEIHPAGKPRLSRILRPAEPAFAVTAADGPQSTAYLRLGLEHLLLGFDHILFVVALALLVPATWPLVKACTAFTAAHSFTLALAALGVVGLPQAPVEAVIALSLLLLSAELLRPNGGSSIRRRPWVIAFAFGLLHGFGFAGTLSAIGLPQDSRVVALFLFNLGVELGQLLIIAAMIAVRHLLRPALERFIAVPACALGGLSAYWLLSRLLLLGR